ncbi:hypothetical protein ACIQVT_11985 [Streptomyces sp. NPDC100445]|uniref:hypothetical protein n=1 Tax=Streptomyces sp. NPDC100445 TaxID=3366102 RepID=UPI0037F9F7F9
MAEIRTAAERLDLVRETVQGFKGARAQSRSARRRGLSRGQNLLLGAALHAAARFDQGLEPTELEASLLEALRAAAEDDAEVASWGRVFAEQRTARGGAEIFPTAVNALDAKRGYELADLRADLEAVTAEIVAQPNMAVVDVTRAAPGESADSEEFVQALAEYGGGVSVLTTPEDFLPAGQAEAMGALPEYLALRTSYFRCEKRSSEPSGKDEIYWAIAAGTDHQEQKSQKSDEMGSVVAGSERWFEVHLVDGPVRSFVSLNIECWEADDSSGGFYNKMREVLRDLSKRLADGSQEQSYNPPDREFNADGWLALLAILGELINALLGWLTNDDDLVCERSIGFTCNALHQYFTPTGREESWLFDGGGAGRHRLYLHGTIRPFPVKGNYRTVDRAGTWSSDIVAAGGTHLGTPMVAISFDGSLDAFYTDMNHKLHRAPSLAAGTLLGREVQMPLAVAVHDNKLYNANLGLDGKLYWQARHEIGTTPVRPMPAWETVFNPALASHNGTLYCAYVAMDGSVYLSTFNASTDGWNPAVQLGGWQTSGAVALTSHTDGNLYLAMLGMDGEPYLAATGDGRNWTGVGRMTSYAPPMSAPPVLASFNGKLYYALRDKLGRLDVGVHGESSSRKHFPVPGYGAPCLAVHGERLYLVTTFQAPTAVSTAADNG